MRRVVVVGADAAGMSAASQALRVAGGDLEVVACESTTHTSYSACGIPYWMAGDVPDGDALVARTAVEHRENGIDLRLRHEVTGLDLSAGEVEVHDHERSHTYRLGYDEVVLATGAEALLPDWARAGDAVLPVKTLDDGAAWRRIVAERRPACALVVGGGYIGVEVAESFARLGITTTLVTRGAEPMSSSFEPAMGALVRRALERLGVDVVTGTEVTALEPAGSDGVGARAACVGGVEYAADVVALGIGVRARTALAVGAGLAVGAHGGLVPDDRQVLADGVWAAGDCCEVWDRVLGEHWFVPLGTHANKAGRVAGTNLGGGSACFPGVVGTAITRAGDAEVARTGLLVEWARRAGRDAVSLTVESTTAAGYMPESDPMTVTAIGERGTGLLLGMQIVGGRGAGKRIDVAATALWNGMRADDVAMLDLAYAPPFSPVWDPVQIACRKLALEL
ncbi:MAG TPA: FAD-dependent oxidoreductase [Actinomycetales bacterium]|nr:FAD-dependent oxidoreductase [Actinomycetales bacterium]